MTLFPVLFVAIMGLGAPELVVILIILLVLFGGAKLPSLAKGLGQSVKEFKKASKEAEQIDAEDQKPAPTAAKVAETKKVDPARTTGTT